MSSELKYRANVEIDDLAIGECTIRSARRSPDGPRYWNLWFHVNREDNGQPEIFVAPVNPNGSFIEDGVGGKTWGLMCTTVSAPRVGDVATATWQVYPSINVLNTREPHPGEHDLPSLWHQTPAIVGVPDGERWTKGTP